MLAEIEGRSLGVSIGFSKTRSWIVDRPDVGRLRVVDKTASCEDLLAAVESAAEPHAGKPRVNPSRDHLKALLTPREYEVFDALGQGLSNKEVASALDITVRTVETHRKAISKKLGCTGAALLRIAVVAKLISLE